MTTKPDTRHLDTAIAILGGGKKLSPKATNAAAEKSTQGRVVVKSGKAVAAKVGKPAPASPRTAAERKTDEALEAAALAAEVKATEVEADPIGTPKKAPKGGPRKGGTTTPDLVATASGMTDPQKYATQAEAVAAAIAAGRVRTAVFEVKPGLYMLGSRRRGLLKGWSYIGRAGGLASKG